MLVFSPQRARPILRKKKRQEYLLTWIVDLELGVCKPPVEWSWGCEKVAVAQSRRPPAPPNLLKRLRAEPPV